MFGVEWRISSLHRALGQSKSYCHMALSSGNKTEHCSGVTEQSLIFLFSVHSLQGKRQHVPHPHLPPSPPLPVHCLWAYLSSQHRAGSPNATTLLLALPARNGQNLPAKTKKLLQNMGLSSFYLLSALQVFKDYT